MADGENNTGLGEGGALGGSTFALDPSLIFKEQERHQKEAERLESEYQRDIAPRQQSLVERLDKTPPAGRLRQERVPAPPQSTLKQDLSDAFGSLLIIGALGGMVGRAHATNALNALAGGYEGFTKQNKDQFDQQMKAWEASVKAIKANNDAALKEYKSIFEARDYDTAQKLQALQIKSAELQHRVMYEQARTGDMTKAQEVYLKLLMHQKQLERSDAEIRNKNQLYEKRQQDMKLAQLREQAMRAGVQSDDQLNELVNEMHDTGTPPTLGRFGIGLASNINRARFNELLVQRARDEGWGDKWLSKARGDMAAIAAAGRAGGTQSANLELILRSAEAAIPAAIEASEKVERGSLLKVNEWTQQYLRQISDPNMKDFALKNLQLAELWARGMNPRGVMRESDRSLALGILTTADAKGTYETAARGIKQFLLRERKAVQEFREHTPVEIEEPSPVAGPATVPTVPHPKTTDEYNAIPSGAKYQHPDDPEGTLRTKR